MKQFLLLGVIALVGISFSSIDMPRVCAQETDEFTLEEITVTAQKRAENQQNVAIAMDVINGDEMRELGYTNLEEILASSSAVFINKSQDGMRVSIRGMADDIRAAGSLTDLTVSTPTVAVNVDGIYTSRRNSGSGLYDMERVEVLYGPQSTLYSTSSPGGIVNIVTSEPKTDRYEVSGKIAFGNYEALQTEGMVNAPMGDNLALRVAFTTSFRDGYLANGSDDEDTKSGRLKVLFKPSDALSFSATGEFTKIGGHGYSGIAMFTTQDTLGDPWDNSDSDSPPPRTQNQKKVSGNLNLDLGIGTVTVLPSYVRESSTATFLRTDMFSGQTASHSMDRSGTEKGTEVRIASSSSSPVKWIIGGNYYRSDVDQMDMPESGQYEYRIVSEKTDAFYGNITYPLTNRFRVTAGARKTSDENYLEEYMIKPMEPQGYIDLIVTTKYDNPDYKIGVEYDLGKDSMLYADWSTSYRSVGMALRPLDPERLKAYTIGSKNRFFGNKLQVNASAFYYSYTDFVADFGMMSDPSKFGRSDDGSLANANLKKYGCDIQSTAIIGKSDKMDFAISYLDSEFTHLVFDFENPNFTDLDFTGKPDSFSPKWTLSLNYSHNIILPNDASLTARLDSRYQTSYLVTYIDTYQEMDWTGGFPVGSYNFLSRKDYITQEAHHISNFSMIYSNSDGKWSFTGYVNNLENYAEKKSFMMDSIMLGPPRTFGAVLTVRL